jgi:hypothetical protein
MYGSHDYETAMQIVQEKANETGHEYVLLPVDEEEGLWTVGLAIQPPTSWDIKNWKIRVQRAAAVAKQDRESSIVWGPYYMALDLIGKGKELFAMIKRRLNKLPQ